MKKFFYRVLEGENLLSISQKFEVSVFSVIKDNRLTKEVECGDILFINREQEVYKLKPLDDIFSVANRLGVSEERLLDLNGNPPYVFYGISINI